MLKKPPCFEMNWLPPKVSNSPAKGTPPVNQNSNPGLEDTADDSEFADAASRDTLTEILRAGAQRMLTAAIEREVTL